MSIAQAFAARKARGQAGHGAGPGQSHAPRSSRLLVLLAVVVLHMFAYSLLQVVPVVAALPSTAKICCLVLVPLRPLDESLLPPVDEPPERPPTPRAISLLTAPPLQVPRESRSIDDAPRSTAPLDLRLPPGVMDEDAAPAGSSAGWVFDRKLARKLDEARKLAHARQRLAGRRAAREGVSEDDYARSSALGDKVKTDAGCFDMREDPDTGHTRWWREACTDSREDAWEQAPFDAEE